MRQLLVVLLLAVYIPTIVGQDMNVIYLPTISQLPERDITAIYRDKDGFLWYATSHGICRDDGYNINVVRFDDETDVSEINGDRNGNIWLATNRGAYILDHETYRLRQFDPERLGNRDVNLIRFTDDGSAWLSQHGKLRRYDAEGKWMCDYPILDRQNKETSVLGFCETRNDEIFVTCYSRGVYKFNPEKNIFEMYAQTADDISLGKMVEDPFGNYLWVNDHDGTIYRFDPKASTPDKIFVSSTSRHPDSDEGKYERLYELAVDDHLGYLWVASRNHLLAFKPESDGHLTPLPLPVCESYNGSFISALYTKDGLIWIATNDRPSSIIRYSDSNVRNMPLKTLRDRAKNTPVINSVAFDRDVPATVWLLQDRTGPVVCNTRTGQLLYNDDSPEMKAKRLPTSYQMVPSDKYNGVWVAQHRRGVLRALSHNGKAMMEVDTIKLTQDVDKSLRVTRLFEDSREQLWIGTDEKLRVYDLNTRRFSDRTLNNVFTTGITESPDGTVWVATRGNGLYRFPAAERAKAVNFGIKQKLTAVSTSYDGKVWLGTDDGKVFRFDPENRKLADHSEMFETDGSSIKHIYGGKSGHIWVVTDQRVFEYNPHNRSCRLYIADVDVELQRFLTQNSCVTPTGELCVGGVGGLAIFKPLLFLDRDESVASSQITDIKVNGVSKVFDEPSDSYKDGSLTLKASDRNIQFHFSSLDPLNTSKTRYAYRIKGVDNGWNYTPLGSNVAFYNYIPDGHHTLEVITFDENSLPGSNVTHLHIDSRPAFYKTYWAYIIYILIAAGLILTGMYFYRRRLRNENEEMWTDSQEMIKMRDYLTSSISLPDEEYRMLDKMFVKKATEEVEAKISEPDFDVSDLASCVNMSRSTFARKIKSITGLTPLEFIKNIKIQHACSLLESQNYTVNEIAEKLGYVDRRYFTAIFKKEMGMSPSDYQKSIKSKQSEG